MCLVDTSCTFVGEIHVLWMISSTFYQTCVFSRTYHLLWIEHRSSVWDILHLYSQIGDLPEVCSTLGVLWDSLTTKELGEVASGRDLRNMSLRKRMLPKILFRFAPPTQKHIACNLHIRFKDEPPEYANSLEGYFWGWMVSEFGVFWFEAKYACWLTKLSTSLTTTHVAWVIPDWVTTIVEPVCTCVCVRWMPRDVMLSIYPNQLFGSKCKSQEQDHQIHVLV